MQNPNNAPAFLPRDQSFRYVDRNPVVPGEPPEESIRKVAAVYQDRLDHLQEQINQMSLRVENKIGISDKSATRHNFVLNGGFRYYDLTTSVPREWTVAGAGVTITSQVGRTLMGRATRIATGGNVGTLTQTLNTVITGQRIAVSAWVKITTGSGLISLTPNGTNPTTSQIKFSSTDGTGGWIPIPGLKKGGIIADIPSDATTVTLKLQADANSTIDFCEVQAYHGTQCLPSLFTPNPADIAKLSIAGSLPNGYGTSGQVLSTDGTGGLSWATPSSGAGRYGYMPVNKTSGATPGPKSNYTAVNSPTGVDNADGSIFFSESSAALNIVGYSTDVTAPYDKTFCIWPLANRIANQAVGVAYYDGTKLACVTVDIDGTNFFQVNIYKFDNVTTYNSSYGVARDMLFAGPVWLRLTDDNTNRKTYFSADGSNWILMHSVGRTDFLTATKLMPFATAQDANKPCGLTWTYYATT